MMTVDPVTLTQDLVRCPSITPRDEGAQVLLARILGDLGFTCTHLPFGEVPNLFCIREEGGPHLCFAGHTDVVPPGDAAAWTYPPFAATIADGNLYGRGTADMKANIAAFIAALSRYTGPGTISLLITGDEEGPATHGTVKVLEWMREHGHLPDAAIVGEPSNPDRLGDEIKIGRRGSLSATLRVRGVQGHVAYPERADNPIPKLARLVAVLSDVQLDGGSDHFGPSTLQFSNLHVGNGADNVIPAQAEARFNIRFCDVWTHATLEDEIRRILNDTGIAHEIDFTRGAVGFLTQPGPLVDVAVAAVESVTGRTPKLSTGGGTSDARFFPPYCPVVEFGLINRTIHKIDEHVALTDLEALSAIYLRMIETFLNGEKALS